MTKEKQVTLKMNARCADAVRQILFEAQRGYSYDYVPERITDIRSVIRNIDDAIGFVVESD
jgi:hypothetical protein